MTLDLFRIVRRASNLWFQIQDWNFQNDGDCGADANAKEKNLSLDYRDVSSNELDRKTCNQWAHLITLPKHIVKVQKWKFHKFVYKEKWDLELLNLFSIRQIDHIILVNIAAGTGGKTNLAGSKGTLWCRPWIVNCIIFLQKLWSGALKWNKCWYGEI